MSEKVTISDRIISDYDYIAKTEEREVLGVFLQGSQNYGLDYEGSDIDTKCIILPAFEDFCLNKKPLSKTVVLESGEHIDVKDIRLMFDCIKKQNINFVEILFTKYKYINPKYKDLCEQLFISAEPIARYCECAAINCMYGMSWEKCRIIFDEKTLSNISKQLYHIVRLNEFMRRYINGEEYKDCLISNKRDLLVKIKMGCYTPSEVQDIAIKTLNDTIKMKDEFLNTHYMHKDRGAEDLLDSTTIRVIRRSFDSDFNSTMNCLLRREVK